MKKAGFFFIIICLVNQACKSPLFSTTSTPHEKYANSLKKIKLDSSVMGRAWLNAAAKSLSEPLIVTIPYRETGYFDASKTLASGYRFSVRRGEVVTVIITKKSVTGFVLFMDLWLFNENAGLDLVEAAQDEATQLQVEIKKDGDYILRLQPELLAGGEYTLIIQTGPSLAFPVPANSHPRIGSLWGDPRSGGSRKHEGIDIFAPMRTPILASAPGIVSVSTNNLGGKVIFLRARNKNYSIYYAHLDSQIVQPGQLVETGELIGLMGKTGNAEHSPPHLHFGIYSSGGAIDPLPFVDHIRPEPPEIVGQVSKINDEVRNKTSAKMYSSLLTNSPAMEVIPANTLLQVMAATSFYYKVHLPDGRPGYISSTQITDTEKPIQLINISSATPLWDKPDTLAAAKTIFKKGEKVNVLARFKEFYYVSANELKGWLRIGDGQ